MATKLALPCSKLKERMRDTLLWPEVYSWVFFFTYLNPRCCLQLLPNSVEKERKEKEHPYFFGALLFHRYHLPSSLNIFISSSVSEDLCRSTQILEDLKYQDTGLLLSRSCFLQWLFASSLTWWLSHPQSYQDWNTTFIGSVSRNYKCPHSILCPCCIFTSWFHWNPSVFSLSIRCTPSLPYLSSWVPYSIISKTLLPRPSTTSCFS